VTAGILEDMSKGFWYEDQYRHDPLPWDINNGWCEDWGSLMIARGSELGLHIDGDWYEKDGSNHFVISYDSRYYDAEAPDGVDSLWDLPIWRQEDRP
jgi:hypothetical protein